jgi:hypothetical protein
MVGEVYSRKSKGFNFCLTFFLKYWKPQSQFWSENKMTFSNVVDEYFIWSLFGFWSSNRNMILFGVLLSFKYFQINQIEFMRGDNMTSPKLYLEIFNTVELSFYEFAKLDIDLF